MFIAQAVETVEAATDPLQVAALTATGTFLAAVVAVVLGQWWQSKREDKRWQRETEQEQVRWNREAEERRVAQNLDDRKRAYIDFMDLMSPWHGWLSGFAKNVVDPMPMPNMGELEGAGVRRFNALRLLAPDSVAVPAEKQYVTMFLVAYYRDRLGAETLGNAQKTIVKLDKDMIQAMRDDVGAGPSEDLPYMPELIKNFPELVALGITGEDG